MIDWKELEEGLFIDLVFSDFVAAFSFMEDVAKLAEEHGHHPNWSNVYNRVSIQLNTHDAGGVVTEKDRTLANDISELLRNKHSKNLRD